MTWLYLTLRKLILPLEEIDTHLPKTGKIIDLGCGQGIIASYISQTISRHVIGIDTDDSRLPESNQKNLVFLKKDLRKISLSKINAAVLSDVLHHLKPGEQKVLIKKVYLALNPNGVLIVKEIDTAEFIRSSLSRFWDFVFYPKDRIYFNSAAKLKTLLTKTGFSQVKILRPCRFFPGSTTLLVCTK